MSKTIIVLEELSKSNYPDFGETVILAVKTDKDTFSCDIGKLKAIVEDGFEWDRNRGVELAFLGIKNKDKPTHFARISIAIKNKDNV